MLLNLQSALKAGSTIAVTLNFKRAAPMVVAFEVRDASGAAGGAMNQGAVGQGGGGR
jgi:copper(I)-binding protein